MLDSSAEKGSGVTRVRVSLIYEIFWGLSIRGTNRRGDKNGTKPSSNNWISIRSLKYVTTKSDLPRQSVSSYLPGICTSAYDVQCASQPVVMQPTWIV